MAMVRTVLAQMLRNPAPGACRVLGYATRSKLPAGRLELHVDDGANTCDLPTRFWPSTSFNPSLPQRLGAGDDF
jgi:hypothetical protein